MIAARTPKLHTCKVPGCGGQYRKLTMAHKACSPSCAVELVRVASAKRMEAKAKAERKEVRARLAKLKTRRDWLKEAQVAFNGYIRARDQGKPCICCGLPLVAGDVGGKFDCGHYRSVGSAPHLRFTEANAAGQRKQCNRWGAGRAVDYRLGLIARIGIEAVEALESDQAPRKWTIPDLMGIKAEYKLKLKALIAKIV